MGTCVVYIGSVRRTAGVRWFQRDGIIGNGRASVRFKSVIAIGLAVMMMLTGSYVLGADYYAYPYDSNDGMASSEEARDQGYAERWTRGTQPWQREQSESEPWRGYDGVPYGLPHGSDASPYGARLDGWSASERVPSSSDWTRREYERRSVDGVRRDNGLSTPPPFHERSAPHHDAPSTPRPDPWADDWRNGVDAQRQRWYGAESWPQDRYAEQPIMRDRARPGESEPFRGTYEERTRDPWDASYTPEWRGDSSSSYYDPEPFEPWAGPETDRNGWRQEIEERPWARRRPSPVEGSRSPRAESRRWEDNAPPDTVYGYGWGPRSYREGAYYPGGYGFSPLPYGAPGPGALSGLAAWERFLWAAGWPGMLWW